MIPIQERLYPNARAEITKLLWSYRSQPLKVGEWHAQVVEGPAFLTYEARDLVFTCQTPRTIEAAQEQIEPNLPWAEDHFQERVGGKPLNPPPSEQWWPHAQQGNAVHKEGEQFSHTYPERYWPKRAGIAWEYRDDPRFDVDDRMGIRFPYGDLSDLVELLARSPFTRQAYLPVWFPEDTGAKAGQRVPCSLGYHFLIRPRESPPTDYGVALVNELHVTYHIRSCDFVRHFADDVYMTVRLAQWVKEQLRLKGVNVQLGDFTMHIGSMHWFEGDRSYMRELYEDLT